MRTTARLLALSLLTLGGAAVLTAARPADAARGGVIKVRFSVTSVSAGEPVDVQASIADGYFADGNRNDRVRTLRGDGEVAVVAELTHTGRLVLASRNGSLRVVASYAAEPPGVRVSEAQWRSLRVAHSGTRIELQRAGSFVTVVGSGEAAARVGARQH